MKIFEVPRNWRTIDYPEDTIGSASITKTEYDEGFQLMEGVDGYELSQTIEPITITELNIDGETVMIDDPMHWIGMKKLAEACEGRVLIGGLGLGLILHHLVKNDKVSKVDVVEINEDVITLIKPLLPRDDRVTVHHHDIFAHRWVHRDYDTIVLDLWVKHDNEAMTIAGAVGGMSLIPTYMRFKANNPHSKIYVWGHRDSAINPAVEPVSEEYMALVRNMTELEAN
ncbi:MAG: hypothetical protein ACTSPB_01155 [Candidatus Thorarchaeota archaeon]